MLYGVVKSQYNGRVVNGKSLIANELYTEKELIKYNIPNVCVTMMNIPKSKVYFSFGVRLMKN